MSPAIESHHFSCSSTRSSIQVIWRPDPTKDSDTTKPDTNFVLTSGAIRGNTGGRNGPQGLEEPMSDEVLREMCDKNYHQLLPLIAEKMQKEKEQKDKLNAVKARLIYAEESGVKIRSHEESHYSESKTPTARTGPRRRRGDRRGVFNSWEERSQLPPARPIGVNKREHHLVRPTNIQKVKIVKEVIGNLGQEGRNQTPMKMISLSLGHVRKEILSHLGSDTLVSRGLGCPATSKHTMEAEIRKTT
ncbi:hypothetical protein Tco_0951247 [Tanacetum coccineum]|uniref:Reverse transcriptase domain-containing protein n=1 Tax=Tanacetum coccineum TaxID=301880 RepID=A0ABQ5DUA9_9ASTR